MVPWRTPCQNFGTWEDPTGPPPHPSNLSLNLRGSGPEFREHPTVHPEHPPQHTHAPLHMATSHFSPDEVTQNVAKGRECSHCFKRRILSGLELGCGCLVVLRLLWHGCKEVSPSRGRTGCSHTSTWLHPSKKLMISVCLSTFYDSRPHWQVCPSLTSPCPV